MLNKAQRAQVRSTITFDRSWQETATLYVELGFEHILPKGLDHILFVLALFFASTRLKPLLIQISVFTLAHTITLGIAAAGWVKAPGSVVEPLIAVSIAFVAIENLVAKEMTPWRPLIVFGFGLFHGLGFARVLIDLGLPDEQFLTALIGFNVGVELGQLSIVLAAWLLFHRLFSRPWYRARVVLPASFLIAVTGSWWAFQRIFLA
ncbi:MAG: HupE/UreJ family protein [Xanthomonadales bacterium]|nr:HupE/UreJ family protein [Gammaproteobacteria bacterium]NND58279.1 HupE/UreJ family protein [Xanthomonadales bacterium]NNK52010.1 HupE/UreJ family protein [Xanthomonadales bacterium]NNL96103.1 HupE/UreJ family protein [Xanthomonadales bacterium]